MIILATFQHPESPIVYEQCNIEAVLNKKHLGTGTIYISERTLCWKGQDGTGFSIEYPHISMHAKTTDPNIYNRLCIFVVIDKYIDLIAEQNADTSANPESDTDSEVDTSELLFVPTDSGIADEIYNALARCQTLNPDPNDSVSDVEEEDDNMYEDAENYEEMAPNNGSNDLGGGGDTEINSLSAQLQNQSVNNGCPYGNGDRNFDDDNFEDAD